MSKKLNQIMACLLTFLLITAPMSELLGGKAYAASSYIISTVAGTGVGGYSGDGGPATSAQLYFPRGVAVDSSGNLYIADVLNHRIRKVDTSGNISTVAGTGVGGYSGDGESALVAQLNSPNGVAVDSMGDLYIGDSGNHRIRKVDKSGNISTVAGTGVSGYSGDGGSATSAKMSSPNGVAIDNSGNLYIGDSGNNRVRKVDTFGNISTVAGTGEGGYAGDGGLATLAKLNNPAGIAVDSDGNLYISDLSNQRVRKVDTSDNISTVAGTGVGGFSGDGGPAILAKLNYANGVRVDSNGNLYIGDSGNNRIRKVDKSGNISTIAGTGVSGYSGDGGSATSAQLKSPNGVAVDSSGNLYIADIGNNSIRKLTFLASAYTVGASTATSTPGVGTDNAVTLTVKDSVGNTDTTFSGTHDVTISGYEEAPDQSYGSFNGTALTAAPNTISVTFISGVATVNLQLNKAGEQTISFSVADVATPAANALSLAPMAGDAVAMELTTDITAPSSNGDEFAQQPVVKLQDKYGNTSTGDSSTVVTVSKKDTGEWTLTGTKTATAREGVVTFTDLGAENASEVTEAQLAFDAPELTQLMSTAVTLPWPGAAAPSVECVTAGDGHVLLSWSEVYGSVNYAIYQRTASGDYGEAVAMVTGTVYDATELSNGTTYYFVVKALNPSGASEASEEVSATPQVPAPGAPILEPAIPGNAQISLVWSAVAGSTGYKIYKSTSSGDYGLEEVTVADSVYGYDVTGLTNGTPYYFVVKAMNPGGESAASNQVSATPKTVPAAPTDVTAVAGNREATIRFKPPVENGGSAITGYEVTASPGNITVVGTASPITITGLSNETVYTFTVRAINSVGHGMASDVSNAVTPRTPSSSSSSTSTTTPTPTTSGSATSSAPAAETTPTPEVVNKVFISSVINEADLVKAMESKIAEAKNANVQVAFADIQKHWAKKIIDTFVKLQMITGYGNGQFKPDGNITRAEFATLISRVFEISSRSEHIVSLSDIENHWAKNDVEKLVGSGVLNGYGNGTFKPNQTISREEMVVILSRIVDLNEVDKEASKGSFLDMARVSSYASNEVKAAAAAGIISGKSNGVFDPQGSSTRAEALTVILNALNLDTSIKTLLESLN
ncbi:S-layer homology domain-containing protein [Paenibacillus sp. OK003]|uniref:NHL domain-containing protein n=1 Tax=Paenibacillus sp. OK003 TaxID=1884380 RepID=UPI0008AD1EC9|nr:S-layer homology domain-containing protein [Paenibacillus sp. OK003]SEL79515.1 NHL repeat-containing protein [Paenibacillus sp. OK003]